MGTQKVLNLVMNINLGILDTKSSRKLRKLSNDIVAEHFAMTLGIDRNINYLFFMYYKGNKKDTFRPFIIGFELNLLLSLGIITKEEKESITLMFNSEDEDNFYIALLALENFRKQRVKVHGKWNNTNSTTKLPEVSKEFIEVVQNYHFKVVKNYSLDKI